MELELDRNRKITCGGNMTSGDVALLLVVGLIAFLMWQAFRR